MSGIAKDNDALFSIYLAKIDSIEREAWAEFDKDVMDTTAKEFSGANPQEIFDTITMIVQDSMAGFAQLPSVESDKKKKPI